MKATGKTIGTAEYYTEMTLRLPASVDAAATIQREAESDGRTIATITVESADDYAFADALLTDVVTRKDALLEMRGSATGPMYKAIKTIEGWFRPAVVAFEAAEKHLKEAMGAYRLAQAATEREARETAARMAEARDAEGLIDALAVAQDAAEAPAGRASVGFAWKVGAVDREALPAEYLTVDWAKLQAIAKAHKGDDPPVVPGVAFERHARVGARR